MTFGIVLLSWMLGLLFAIAPVGQSFDQRLSDWVWRLLDEPIAESRFVFVDIDERSLSEVGAWPWSRDQMARLIEALQRADASEITVDAIFPDKRSGDRLLAETIGRQPTPVGSVTFALPGNEAVQTGVLPDSVGSNLCDQGLFPEAIGFLGNTATLPLPAGHITPRVDDDGVVRAMPAFICFEGEAYPALALAAFLRATGLTEEWLTLVSGSWSEPTMSLRVGDALQIPLTLDGHLIVPFEGQASEYSRISAADVLAGTALPSGRWVVVGSSAVGLSDRVATPLAPLEAGALIHLRLLRGLLDDRLPSQMPAISSVLWLVAMLVCGCLGAIASMTALRWWVAPFAMIGFVLAALVTASTSANFSLSMHGIRNSGVAKTGGKVSTNAVISRPVSAISFNTATADNSASSKLYQPSAINRWPLISPASGAPVSFNRIFIWLWPVFHNCGWPPDALT